MINRACVASVATRNSFEIGREPFTRQCAKIRANFRRLLLRKNRNLHKFNLLIPDDYMIDSAVKSLSDDKISLPARAANFQTIGGLANYLSNIANSKRLVDI